MKVKDLKKYLEAVSDDTLAVIKSSDHCYYEVDVELVQAAKYENEFTESEGIPGEELVPVLVFW